LNKNKEIGLKGELIASDYLINAGYQLLRTNYRYNRYEIDIIAEKNGMLVFFEVKTRRSFQFGQPEDAVDDKKINHILECADYFIHEIQWKKRIRFDILSISLLPEPSVNHIKNAFS
jgi:putative endonuclease